MAEPLEVEIISTIYY